MTRYHTHIHASYRLRRLTPNLWSLCLAGPKGTLHRVHRWFPTREHAQRVYLTMNYLYGWGVTFPSSHPARGLLRVQHHSNFSPSVIMSAPAAYGEPEGPTYSSIVGCVSPAFFSEFSGLFSSPAAITTRCRLNQRGRPSDFEHRGGTLPAPAAHAAPAIRFLRPRETQRRNLRNS